MKDIIIFGNGQYAKNIYLFIKKDDRYNVKAFVVDKKFINEEKLYGVQVIPYEHIEQQFNKNSISILIAIGYTNLNKNREKVYKKLKKENYKIETYIHPDAKVFSNNIGEGCVFIAGAVIETNTNIGKCVVAWSNTVIAHDSIVEDFCWIASGTVISADCYIGKSTFIGVNATISNFVKMGESNFIGAAAIIHKNTNDNEVYIQKPSKKFRLSSQNFIRMSKI